MPEHPVLSLVSKQVFEKRLIDKYLAEHGTDPITGEPLAEDMIVEIKSKYLIIFGCLLSTYNFISLFCAHLASFLGFRKDA